MKGTQVMKKHFLTGLVSVAAILAATALPAQVVVIEGFEDSADPAGWRQISPAPQTQNAVNAPSANVPSFVTNNVTEGAQAGSFPIDWTIPGTAAGTNPYNNTGPLLYWSMRTDIASPAALPNNTIPNTGTTLRADIFNPTSDTNLQVAFYVQDSAGTGGLERGPFVTLAPNATTTYQWVMGVDPVVSFITGNSVLDGSSSKLRGFFTYSEVEPTADPLTLIIDNIRIETTQTDLQPPAAPVLLSASQGANVGEVVLRWAANSETDLVGYRVYQATDTNFGENIANRFSFPNAFVDVPGPTVTQVTLTGLPTEQNIYFRLTAYDNATPTANESISDITLAVRLKADGTQPSDLLVLDYDRYAPTNGDFTINGYFHGSVYWAQALSTLNRTFNSARAAAVDAGIVTLTPNPAGLVMWSTGRDGELVAGETLSASSITALTNYVGANGKLFITGTSLGKDLTTTNNPAGEAFYTNVLKAALVNENANEDDIDADARFATAGALATGPNVFDVAAGAQVNNEVVSAAPGGTGVFNYLNNAAGNAGVVSALNVVYLAFSFESVRDPAAPASFAAAAAKRAALLQDVIAYYNNIPLAAQGSWNLYE
jgi:hypothetical protein